MHNRIHPIMADVIGAHFGPPAPLVEPSFRDHRQHVDVALMAATSVMRQRLEAETGDQLDEAVAMRIMAAATAAFSAALAAQCGVGR